MTQVDQTRAKEATAVTAAANAAVRGALPFDDREDFDDVRRGLIAEAPAGPVTGAGGRSGTRAPTRSRRPRPSRRR
jgi:alkyl sulfatase BDS1-like metallo-beta-lactamase superfamily hydrolase